MYEPSMTELNQTDVEKKLASLVNIPNIGVTCSYQGQLEIINRRLQDLYGDMADWSLNLGHYLRSEVYRNETHFVDRNIDNIIEINNDVIFKAVTAEAYNNMLGKRALEEYQKWKADREVEHLAAAAEMLGVLPSLDSNFWGLNEYYVVFPKDVQQRKQIREDVLKYRVGLLDLIVNMMLTFYEQALFLTYPNVGTMITQPRGKMFWRGENAFYGSSRPSASRVSTKLPGALSVLVESMRYDECGMMLDRIEAVRNWQRVGGNVNYMAIMQHYGLPTRLMDITSDIKTALFFACCKWENNGRFSRWLPLEKKDFEKKDSRPWIAKLGGDSRYGILYKARADIEDLMWLVVEPKTGDEGEKSEKHVIPIGYQPFNRAKAQHGYMLEGIEDLYQDAQFDKVKFRLNEELCQWIFREMDKGDKIYPLDDVPDLGEIIAQIAKAKVFSKSIFEDNCKCLGMNVDDTKERLTNHGILISDHEEKWISNAELEKINQEYSLEQAWSKMSIHPVAKPLVII